MADTKMMSFARHRPRGRLRRGQDGFTLIEMMITMLLLTIVVGAMLAILDDTTSVANRDQERNSLLQDAQASQRRMVNELGEAVRVVQADPNTISFIVREQGSTPRKRITYECAAAYTGPLSTESDRPTYRQCNRSENVKDTETVCCDAPTGGTSVVDLLRNGTVTQYAPAATCPGNTTTIVPVFTYRFRRLGDQELVTVCNAAGTALTAPQQTQTLAQIGITFRLPERGERIQGGGAFQGDPNMYLQAGAFLKNMQGRYAG